MRTQKPAEIIGMVQEAGKSAGTTLPRSADFRLTDGGEQVRDGDEQVRLVLAGRLSSPPANERRKS